MAKHRKPSHRNNEELVENNGIILTEDGEVQDASTSDRRDLLKLLGMGAAGAVGASLIEANPASAADGNRLQTVDVFNVRRYGATGNGSTDDTTAIQAAVDACHGFYGSGSSSAGYPGGVVYFPPGVYLFTSQLLYYPGQTWMGAGEGGVSTLWCNVDLGEIVGFNVQGPGNFGPWNGYAAIDSGATASHGFASIFQDLYISGPAGGTATGSETYAGNKTTGIRMGSSMRLYRCLISGWFAGVAIWEDHQLLMDCYITQNYYNVDWPDNAGGGGNQHSNCLRPLRSLWKLHPCGSERPHRITPS